MLINFQTVKLCTYAIISKARSDLILFIVIHLHSFFLFPIMLTKRMPPRLLFPSKESDSYSFSFSTGTPLLFVKLLGIEERKTMANKLEMQ